MFESARLKLTAWYILIAVIITGLFSTMAYNGFRFEFERGLQKQRVYIEQTNPLGGYPNFVIRREPDPLLMQELRDRLLFRILYIDLAVIVAATVGGYWLAGRTLKPIKTMVDEQHRFITDASHELRTPLTALRSEMETTLLSKELSSQEAKTVIKSNLEEVIRLQDLSDHLLELAQYQHRLSVKVDVSIKETLEEAVLKLTPLAKKKRIVLKKYLKESIIKGDKRSLVELMVIILDNAIKYSPPQSTITVTTTTPDHKVLIKIKDEGIGISEEELPHIFDRFYRSDKSRTKSSVNGYGLGLAIAKQIVQAHNGRINVKSVIDKGTTFSISLPRK